MKKIFLCAVTAMTAASSAHAQYMLTEGNFESKNAELRTILLDEHKGIVAASAVVTLGSCSGTIAGIGTIKDRTLVIKPYVKVEGGEQCVLRAKFDAKWERVQLSEGEGCSVYHGAACAWEGQTVKRKE